MLRRRRVELRGRYDPRFQGVVDELGRQIRRFGGGAAACVYLEGEPVVDVWGGTARADGTPWRSDTLAIGYSATKGVTSTALHLLADEGRVDYDAPVARYWPEFAQAGKAAITVRELLSHQAGLQRIVPLLERATDVLDWRRMVERLARARPAFEPGSANAYHALTYGWLVGEIVERVSGLPFSRFIAERIAGPLGLDGLHIGLPASELERVADVVGLAPVHREERRPLTGVHVPRWLPRGPARRMIAGGFHPRALEQLFRHPDFWTTPIPAANGAFTARALARMYAALAEGGSLDGARLVGPGTVERMGQVQTRRLDRVVVYPLHWTLGFHRADAVLKSVPEAFGHFGLAGTGGWANPRMRMSAALMHNGNPLTVRGQVRTVWLTGAVYRSLGAYRGVLGTLAAREPTVLTASR